MLPDCWKCRVLVVGSVFLFFLAGCPSSKHTLRLLTSGQGTVALVPPGGSYDAGTTVTLTPTPGTGWHFDHWEGALSGSANPAQVTMDADKTVTAVFAIDQYALTVVVTGQGTVALVPPGGSYDAGTTVTLTPTPGTGWHFDHWEGALSGNANPTQATMDADKTVTAVFAIDQYALSVAVAGQGTVALVPPGGSYDAGTTVTLTPTPGTGWHFDHWEGALTGSANPAQVTMDADKTVTAIFAIDQYALTVVVTGQGTVALVPPGGSYDAGTTVTLTPTPGTGWHFDHWEGALSGNANPTQVTMDADKTVTAIFAIDQYALTVVVTGQGTVALVPPGGSYDAGTVVTLTATPTPGWHFDHWEGALSGGATVVQLAMDASKTVTAVFQQDQYTLELSIGGGGSVTLDPPGGTYPSGSIVTLTPNPEADTRFEIWGGDLAGTKQPASLTMNESKYVQAFFMPRTFTGFQPNNLCAVDSVLYFLGTGVYSGRELWISDGTFEGTRLVKDIAPGYDSPNIPFLANLNGTLYFFAATAGTYGLWTSDGTEDGTLMVADLGGSFPALAPVEMNGYLYFSATGTEDGELWVTDGTAEGTGIVKSFGPSAGMLYSNPGQLTNVDGVLYFNNAPQTDTFTLWKTDGTEEGTVAIYSSRWLSEIAGLNGQVFFYAGTESTNSLFVTDGTPEGTHKVRDYFFGPGDFTLSGGLLYFAAESDDLFNTRVWATNGSIVYRVDDDAYRPWDLIDLDGTLLFEALYEVESVIHTGLFATTGSGASLVRGVNPTLFYGVESYHVTVGGILYFAAENTFGGLGLWKSDGTTAGTALVSEINPDGQGPYYLTDVNGTLFFAAQDDAHGCQLWTSDGTPEGTFPVSCPFP